MASIQRKLLSKATKDVHRRAVVTPFLRRKTISSDASKADDNSTTPSEYYESNDMVYGDPRSTRRLTKLVSVAVAQSARIIGVTGIRKGVGVSVTSRQIAGAFASYGATTLLVDLSGAEISDSPSSHGVSFLDVMTEVSPSLGVVDVARLSRAAALGADQIRDALAETAQKGFTVIVDLPPVLQSPGPSKPVVRTVGSQCDIVFLVCLSGVTKRSEVIESLDASRIMGLKLGGVVLNDWRLPANGLLES